MPTTRRYLYQWTIEPRTKLDRQWREIEATSLREAAAKSLETLEANYSDAFSAFHEPDGIAWCHVTPAKTPRHETGVPVFCHGFRFVSHLRHPISEEIYEPAR